MAPARAGAPATAPGLLGALRRAAIGLQLVRHIALAALLGLALSLSGAAGALAQFQRALPEKGVLGVLRADATLQLPLVRVDNRVLRLAPGAIIVDQNNRTLVHAQIPPQSAAYMVFDNNGDILRMFLLTPDELQRVKAR